MDCSIVRRGIYPGCYLRLFLGALDGQAMIRTLLRTLQDCEKLKCPHLKYWQDDFVWVRGCKGTGYHEPSMDKVEAETCPKRVKTRRIIAWGNQVASTTNIHSTA